MASSGATKSVSRRNRSNSIGHPSEFCGSSKMFLCRIIKISVPPITSFARRLIVREEPRRDQRARKGVGVATKFLKPSRRMMFIHSEMSSTRRHDGALCASRNRSHRHLGRRYAFVMCHFEPMNDGMLAVASFGNFAPHTLPYGAPWQIGGVSHNWSDSRQQRLAWPLSGQFVAIANVPPLNCGRRNTRDAF